MSLARASVWRSATRTWRTLSYRTIATKPPTPPETPTPTSTAAAGPPSGSDESGAAPPPEDVPLTPVSKKPPLHMRPRRPRHPNTTITGLDSQRAVNLMIDPDGGAGATKTGRAWRAAELRLKSFSDLHKLWFVLVRERDRLLMERAWCKTNGRYWTNGLSNYAKVRQSMARVKAVVGERIHALDLRKRKQAIEELERDGQPVSYKLRKPTKVDPNKAEVSAAGTPPLV